jgi:hypothetical protein
MNPHPKSTELADLIRVWPLSFESTLGSSLRAVGIFLEVRAGLPSSARKALTIKSRELTLRMPGSAASDFAKLSARISKALEGIESLPIIPREIQDILGISSTERRRWLADGRLPSAGTRTVRLRGRAKKVVFHVFDPRLVEDVLDRGLVDTWREEDVIAAAENRRRAVWKSKVTRTQSRPASNGTKEDTSQPDLKGWEEFEREGLLR